MKQDQIIDKRIQQPEQQKQLRLFSKMGPQLVQASLCANPENENQGSEERRIGDQLQRGQVAQTEFERDGHGGPKPNRDQCQNSCPALSLHVIKPEP